MWNAARTGKGQVVDAAMVDGSAVLTTMLHGLIAQGEWRDEAGVNFADTGSPFYEVYECSDGRFVAVGAIERQFYVALLDGLGLDETKLPDRRDPTSWPELKKSFAEVFATRSRDEWAVRFAGTDACVAPVLTLTEAPQHPHNVERGTFVDFGGVVQPAPAPRFSRTQAAFGRTPPVAGDHSVEVLAEIGYGDVEIKRLFEAGAVQ
jgi:alpha-methylacyl-CoA racemase